MWCLASFVRYSNPKSLHFLLIACSWTVGLPPDFPANGEIDIIENIHERTTNLETLHTNAGCKLTPAKQGGTIQGDGVCDNNYERPPFQYKNQGCSVSDDITTNAPSYGTPFNNIGGGVYAMVSRASKVLITFTLLTNLKEWTATTIKIWNFPRTNVPVDITSGIPDPSLWGTPTLTAGGDVNCDVSAHFKVRFILP